MHNCKICSEKSYLNVDFNNFYLRTDSGNKNLHNYEMRVCSNCGVVYQYPQITKEVVENFYRSNYRPSSVINLEENKKISFPLHFEQTGISFQRFYNFYKIVTELLVQKKIKKIDNNSTFLDFGAYQGSFLYACKEEWNSKTIATDFNIEGLKFAKNYLGINKTYESKNIYNDIYDEDIDICTVIHVLEHLHEPVKFLDHVKKNILKNKGFIYIEVPSAESSTYDDPTHLFMFTKQSLAYLMNLAGYNVLHISERNIYEYSRIKLLKRHVQTMIHCIAVPRKNDEVIEKIDIGKLIKNQIEKKQYYYSNRLFYLKLKITFKEVLSLVYHAIFIFIGLLFKKTSFEIYLKSNSLLKKLYINIKNKFRK